MTTFEIYIAQIALKSIAAGFSKVTRIFHFSIEAEGKFILPLFLSYIEVQVHVIIKLNSPTKL